MNPRLRFSLVLAIALGAFVLVFACTRAFRAESAAREAERRAGQLGAAAAEIDTLHAGLPAWATSSASESDTLAKRAGQVVASAGLPASALSSFATQSELTGTPTASGSRIERRKANMVLTGVTLPQLGSFLNAWRSREPEWVVAGIDVSPDGLSSASRVSAAGGDLPLRVVLTAESLALRRSTTGRPRTEGTR